MSRRRARIPALLLATSLVGAAFAIAKEPIAPTGSGDEIRRTVAFLASAKLDGRLTGTRGAERAAEYVADRLAALGARPLPGQDRFAIGFEFTAGTRDAGSSLALLRDGNRARSWKGVRHVQALSFSDNGTVEAPVVFAGYGLTVPEGQDFGYDSFHGLDVKDKIVVVLRYFPEDAPQEARNVLSRYSGLRYKALRAREAGARALVVVTGPRSPNAGETVPMAFDTALAGSGIVAASISGDVADEIFAAAGKSLAEAQAALDSANPHVSGFELPGLTLHLGVEVAREKRTADNVVGWLPATVGPERGAPGAGWIVIGAHYDHLGHGAMGNSLARKEETGQVHHGADDNASGVAAALAVGARLAAGPRERPIALAFWAGEEIGILGSTDFLERGILPREDIAAYVNFDMVGRLTADKLSLQAVGSSPAWPALIEQANAVTGLDVNLREDPYLPTDTIAFYQAQVPALDFFTGNHEDYHRPTDTAERINYEGLERIVDLAERVVRKLAAGERPAYATVARQSQEGPGRDSVRAFTGTIPDYTTQVEGLRLSGVVAGGPADQAGLREGDVIVEFGAQKIANIYDYTYALDAVKIGQPVKVVFLRDGERRDVEMVPTSRK